MLYIHISPLGVIEGHKVGRTRLQTTFIVLKGLMCNCPDLTS